MTMLGRPPCEQCCALGWINRTLNPLLLYHCRWFYNCPKSLSDPVNKCQFFLMEQEWLAEQDAGALPAAAALIAPAAVPAPGLAPALIAAFAQAAAPAAAAAPVAAAVPALAPAGGHALVESLVGLTQALRLVAVEVDQLRAELHAEANAPAAGAA